jgi:hypothetical protein
MRVSAAEFTLLLIESISGEIIGAHQVDWAKLGGTRVQFVERQIKSNVSIGSKYDVEPGQRRSAKILRTDQSATQRQVLSMHTCFSACDAVTLALTRTYLL